MLALGGGHLLRVLREYAGYFNQHRPHQGMRQQVPDAPAGGTPQREWGGNVRAIPVLGGLHRAYQRAA